MNQSFANNFNFSFYPENVKIRNFGDSINNNSRELYRTLNRDLREIDFTNTIKTHLRKQESAKFLKFENTRPNNKLIVLSNKENISWDRKS